MSVIPDKSTHNRPKKQLYISIAFQKEMQRFKRFKDPKDKTDPPEFTLGNQ